MTYSFTFKQCLEFSRGLDRFSILKTVHAVPNYMMWTISGTLVSHHINQVFPSPTLVLSPIPGAPLAASWIVEELAPDFHCTWWKIPSVCLQGSTARYEFTVLQAKTRESVRRSHYLLLWVIDAKYHQNDVNIILLCSSLLSPACITSAVTGCCISQPLFPLPLRV